MIPQPQQHIIIFLRNGITLEGDVVSWSDGKSAIISNQGTTTTVIQKTLEDVLFYKLTNYKQEYEEIKEKPIKNEEDIKKLAELKNEMNEMEKAELREKLSSHQPSGAGPTNYELPSIFKSRSSFNNPRKESSGTNPGLDTELQNLFSKERKNH